MDHYTEAQRLISAGNLDAATVHALLAGVDAIRAFVEELRADQPIDYVPIGQVPL